MAFTVTYALTGSVAVATSVGLIEPLANTVAFYFHERAWRDYETTRGVTVAPQELREGFERAVHRQLREALPHHIVLSKLPLVRFCQPADPKSVRYWFDLLGANHVTFAVCSANGRVLGMMPHPERAIEPAAVPALGGADGRKLFENILASLAAA